MIITFVLLFGPKILGSILVFSRKHEIKGFGGRRRILAGLGVEMLLSALVAPMLMFTQTRALVEILAGKVGGWATQRRDADKVTGREAFKAMGWISVAGLTLAVMFWFTPDLLTATLPILAGLVLAVPLTMLGAHKVAGLGVKANGLFMTPEERRPPAIVRAALGPACEPPAAWFAGQRHTPVIVEQPAEQNAA
jgi:membrane glycosyltransferase